MSKQGGCGERAGGVGVLVQPLGRCLAVVVTGEKGC